MEQPPTVAPVQWYLQPKFLYAGGAVALVLAGLGIYALTRQS